MQICEGRIYAGIYFHSDRKANRPFSENVKNCPKHDFMKKKIYNFGVMFGKLR